MNKIEKIYDKNGVKLELGDNLFDGYEIRVFDTYFDDLFIIGRKSVWRIENFYLTCYEDGYCLVDFEKC